MASVDDRIVRMQFDNAEFERKVGTTLGTIDKLNKSLEFKGAKEGLQGVSQEASKFNLGHLGDAIQGIASKFQSLGIIGITILSNITNKAINAGLQIAKSLSLDNIISGFKEYEMNIGSIQTILSNTKADGTNLQQVNAALDQLNTYADKTIYNFGQMTKNIGTFTAAGIDLDTSVSAIKGISNLAAISGSSADQASNAMYQLSQAVSTGTLKLMDWNSVVNAGMGGEVFQKALFETGKAMGTIKNAKLDTTFEEWTKASGSFRGSLETGWATSEVLTNTLKGFTGEMTDAQLAAIGYSKEQIANIQELGKTGVDAATKVRTLTGLIDTTKEAIGSGWSESFRIVIGNFEEATTLFTGISNSIGDMVSRSSKARNELLGGWAYLGGRKLLIDSITEGVKALAAVLKPIKDAFREVFPPATAMTLFHFTKMFSDFTKALMPSTQTVNELKRVFMGLFSILKIGWTVIKEGVTFIGELLGSLTGAGSGAFLAFLANIGDFFNNLRTSLVTGGAINDFFDTLREKIKGPIAALKEFADKIRDFFDKFDPKMTDQISGGFDRVGQRFKTLKDIFAKVGDLWGPLKTALDKVAGVLDACWQAIKTWFQELGQKLADSMEPGDYDAAIDTVNAGLLGGIVAMLAKFMKSGFKLDLGDGLFEKVGKSFDSLTKSLDAMQTKIKSEALLKIAEAIGLLTASVLVLSFIDSDKLAKSLAAMAVGFTQLMASFAALAKMNSGPKGSANLAILSTSLILLSGAMLVLAVAAKIMSTMDLEGLAKGLGGVTAMLTVMIATVKILGSDISGMIGAGLGMIAIAAAMVILAAAVKIFSTMSWTEIAKGLAGVAGGLLIIAGAMQLMPTGMALQGVGILAVAAALNILALAVLQFSKMSWGEMGKGMVGIAGGLLIIAGAMQLMPSFTMPIIGAGLILVGVGLIAIGTAMKVVASLSWGEIAKGLVGIAGALLILAVATNAMSGSLVGAIAIGVVSASLLLLAKAIKAFADISWGDLLHGLIAVAAALVVLGLAALALSASGATVAMLAMGAALIVIGAGFALFGAGAYLVASAFEKLAKAGKAGSEALVASLHALGAALPALFTGFAEGVIQFALQIAKGAPVIAKALGVLLLHIADTLIKLVPKLGEIIRALIEQVFLIIQEYIPKLVETGMLIITSLLTGIRDNIDDVVILVGEIITGFLDAMAIELPKIVQSVADLFIAFMTSVAEALGRVSSTMMFGVAISFIIGFVDGLENAVGGASGPMHWFMELAGKVLGWIGDVATTLWNKGIDFITGLFGGITGKIKAVTTFFQNLGRSILGWIGSVLSTLKQKGTDLIQGILNGINAKISSVSSFFSGLPNKIKGWVGGLLTTLYSKGQDVVNGFKNGLDDVWGQVKTFFTTFPSKIKSAIGSVGNILYDIGRSIITGLWDGMKSVWNDVTGWLGGLASHIPKIKGPPSKDKTILVNNGRLIIQGLHAGMQTEWEDNTTTWLGNLGNEMTKIIGDQGISPTITPVLDLTQLQEDSKKIAGFVNTSATLAPTLSFSQARTIAAGANAQQTGVPAEPATKPQDVTFNQNIYAPEQLSTADIYRQTRNQITMAKEALSIP